MIIEKIHIDAFGRLENRDFELSEGVNIIEGANESGKSTLAAFIRFVFYGCSPREREAALSWKSGGASGSTPSSGGASSAAPADPSQFIGPDGTVFLTRMTSAGG